MSYGELYLPPEMPKRNAVNGRFLKGHIPANKGKKWEEYMGKRAMKRAMRGWKNLDKFRPKERPDNAGRCRKQVIAVTDDGTWRWFSHIGSAADFFNGIRENVGRCCRLNQSRRKNKKTGAVNTDHTYKGVRFYFEENSTWVDKIKS